MEYRIRNTKNGLLWSNDWGWGGAGYDVFDQRERDAVSLPADGVWEEDTPLTLEQLNALDNEDFEYRRRLPDWSDAASDNN